MSSPTVSPTRRDVTLAAPSPVPGWACLLIGVGAAVLGLLPWLRTGLRLPVQNLWAADTPPNQLPGVLLPFSQYAVTLLIGIVVVGAAVAGVCGRALRPRLSRWGFLRIAVGLLTVQIGSAVQTAVVVRAGLRSGLASVLYLVALSLVVVLSVLVGGLVVALMSATSRAPALIGVSIGALALAPWLDGLLAPPGGFSAAATLPALLHAARWTPAVVIGLTIAWAGIASTGRALAAGLSLVLLWLVPPLTTALQAAAGTRVYFRHPAELAEVGRQVVVSAATSAEIVLPLLGVAVGVAAAGLVVRPVFLRPIAPG